MRYYQHMNQEISFLVWRNFENCVNENNCPKNEIRAYEYDDIEAPKFMDVDIYNDKEIELFLLKKLMNNCVGEVRSFLEVNDKTFYHGMTHFLNYVCLDHEKEIFVKTISENVFYVIKDDRFKIVSLLSVEDKTISEVLNEKGLKLQDLKNQFKGIWKMKVASLL